MKKVAVFLAFLFSCGLGILFKNSGHPAITIKYQIAQNQKDVEEKIVKTERQPTSVFPFFIAGTIGIIQKVYFKKDL